MTYSTNQTLRIQKQLEKNIPYVREASMHDKNEAETRTIIRGILEEVFCFDRRSEIFEEVKVLDGSCDLVVKFEGEIAYVIETKAINVKLNDRHVKQVVRYAHGLGVNWAVLTNGAEWRIYHVTRGDCGDAKWTLLDDFNLMTIDVNNREALRSVYLLTKRAIRGIDTSGLAHAFNRKQVLSPSMMAAAILSPAGREAVVSVLNKMHGRRFQMTDVEWRDICNNNLFRDSIAHCPEIKNTVSDVEKVVNKGVSNGTGKRTMSDGGREKMREAQQRRRQREREGAVATPAFAPATPAPVVNGVPVVSGLRLAVGRGAGQVS